jgi:hypothetical protein
LWWTRFRWRVDMGAGMRDNRNPKSSAPAKLPSGLRASRSDCDTAKAPASLLRRAGGKGPLQKQEKTKSKRIEEEKGDSASKKAGWSVCLGRAKWGDNDVSRGPF